MVGSTFGALRAGRIAYPSRWRFVTSRAPACRAASSRELEELRQTRCGSNLSHRSFLARFWRKAIVTAVAAIGFVSLYEVTILDSRYVAAAGDARRHVGRCPRRRAPRVQRHRVLQGHRSPPPACRPERHRRRRSRAAAGRIGRRDRVAADRRTTASTRSWTPGPASRAARSTSTCGAATRRCSSAAGRSA